jgi:hypothetical protein
MMNISLLELERERIATIDGAWDASCIDTLKEIAPNRLIWLNKEDIPDDLAWVNDIPSISVIPGLPIERIRNLRNVTFVKCGDLSPDYETDDRFSKLHCTGFSGVYPKRWSRLKTLEIWDLKHRGMLDLSQHAVLSSLVLKGNNSIDSLTLNRSDRYRKLYLYNCSRLTRVLADGVDEIDLVEIGNSKKIDLGFLSRIRVKSLILSNFGEVTVRLKSKPIHVGGSSSRITVVIEE